MGADFHFTTVNFYCKQVKLLKEKLCLCLLTTSSAHRTPCMVMPLNTQQTTISHHFLHGKVGFTQVSVFSAGTLLGFILGVNLPIEVCWQKHCLNTVKTWMWCFKNPPRKTLWVLILPSLWSIFCRYQKTILKKHLTRSWSHRTPRFIMACLVMQLNTQNNQFTPFPSSKGCLTRVYFQCWETVRKHDGCEHDNWDLLAKTALILWKQECVILKSTWEKVFSVWINTFTTINFGC